MTNEQKKTLQYGLDWATTHIQEIEASAECLHDKSTHIEWQLLLLLDDVVLALPKAMREQAQACLDIYHRTNDALLAEIDARYAHKEASPICLQAVDSLSLKLS